MISTPALDRNRLWSLLSLPAKPLGAKSWTGNPFCILLNDERSLGTPRVPPTVESFGVSLKIDTRELVPRPNSRLLLAF